MIKYEKEAKELVEQFNIINSNGHFITSNIEQKAITNRSKECALIVVDLVLDLQNKSEGKWLPCVVPDTINYWQKVKEAIKAIET